MSFDQYLSSSDIREHVIQAAKAFKENGKTLAGKEIKDFFNPFYEKVKNEIDNMNDFIDLCILEIKYGFVNSYIGGVVL